MTTADLITRARALLAAATSGPWEATPSGGGSCEGRDHLRIAFGPRLSGEWPADDAALIAAAPTLIAELCEALESAVRHEGDMSRAYDEQTVMVGKLSDDFEKAAGERDRLKTNFRRMQMERDEARAERDELLRTCAAQGQTIMELTKQRNERANEIAQMRVEIVECKHGNEYTYSIPASLLPLVSGTNQPDET